MKQLRAARKAHEISQGKVIARRCPYCGRFRLVSVAEHEKHEKRCHSTKRKCEGG